MSKLESSADARADREDHALHPNTTTSFKIRALALLAIPLGFGGFLFFGANSVAWLPTPLRRVPFSVFMGSLLMAVYQKIRRARLKDIARWQLACGPSFLVP